MKEKTRLLIVEDERIVAMDLRQRLQRFNYEVVDLASSGASAIEAVETHRPDLILMDIRIQGEMDGIQTADFIRKKYNVPHIFLTAHRDDDTINRAKHTEPDGYLLKPFNDREIQTTIEMALYKHEMRDKLLLSELKFRSLIQNSSDVVTVVDFDGNFDFASPSVKMVLGYEPDVLQGKNLSLFVHEADIEIILKFLKRLRNAEKANSLENPRKLEFRFEHAEKGWVYLEAVGSYINVDGFSKGMVINARDITDRKRIEMELRQAKHKAEEMNRLKTTFLSNISHEIRTPLTGIMGFSSILESELEDKDHLSMVENISKSGYRLLETVDAVLDLALLESSKIEVELEPVNLSREVEQAVRMLAALAIEKSLRIKIVAKNDSDEVHMDKRLLAIILNHIIGNAIKFTHKGSVTITVDRENVYNDHTETRTSFAIIEVKDTGVGMEESFIPHIFDEFKQESEGNTRKYEGAGIGLSIAKRLLDLMSGTVKVESVLNKGSTFTLKFSL